MEKLSAAVASRRLSTTSYGLLLAPANFYTCATRR